MYTDPVEQSRLAVAIERQGRADRTCDFLPAYLHFRPSVAITGKSPAMIFWYLCAAIVSKHLAAESARNNSRIDTAFTFVRSTRRERARSGGLLGRVRLLHVREPLLDRNIPLRVSVLHALRTGQADVSGSADRASQTEGCCTCTRQPSPELVAASFLKPASSRELLPSWYCTHRLLA